MEPRPPLPAIGTPCDDPIADAEPIATIDYYDGPLCWVSSRGDERFMVCWYDFDDRAHRYFVVSLTPERLDAFAAGNVEWASVFDSPEPGHDLWAVDCNGNDTIAAWRITPADLPDDHLSGKRERVPASTWHKPGPWKEAA